MSLKVLKVVNRMCVFAGNQVVFVQLLKGEVSHNHHNNEYGRTGTHAAVTHKEVGRAAGENMRIVNCEGGSKREFSFSLFTMLKKESITLLSVKTAHRPVRREEGGEKEFRH